MSDKFKDENRTTIQNIITRREYFYQGATVEEAQKHFAGNWYVINIEAAKMANGGTWERTPHGWMFRQGYVSGVAVTFQG